MTLITCNTDTPAEFRDAIANELSRQIITYQTGAWLHTTIRAKAVHQARIDQLTAIRNLLLQIKIEPKTPASSIDPLDDYLASVW